MLTIRPNHWAASLLVAWAGTLLPVATFLALGAAVTLFPNLASEVQLCAIILTGAVTGFIITVTGLLRTKGSGWQSTVPVVVLAFLVNGYVGTGTLLALLDLMKHR